MPDPVAFLTNRLAWIHKNSNGAFDAEALAPSLGTLRDQLTETDRTDFLVPVMLPPSGRVGRGKGGIVVTLEDRAIVGWGEGLFGGKWRSATLPYDSIQSVKRVSWGSGESSFNGLDVTTPERVWTFAFRSADPNVDLERWREILRNRLEGLWVPLWQGDQVSQFVRSEVADQMGTPREADTGRHYDKKALQLEANESVRAATCGALRCQEPSQITQESGTLFLTSARLIFVTPTEDRLLGDVATIGRSTRDLGDKQVEIITIAFNDGSNWELASTTRTQGESEYFCSAVGETLAGITASPG